MSNPKFKTKKPNLEIKDNESLDISLNKSIHENIGRLFLIKVIVIPFKSLFRKYKKPDLYTGAEDIPFEKRHPEFQTTMKEEFLTKR